MQDFITQEDKCCLGSLSLQNISSIRGEMNLLHRVGTVIMGGGGGGGRVVHVLQNIFETATVHLIGVNLYWSHLLW